MLHNTAEPKVMPRSQKAHRGAKNHTAEQNFLPRSHYISTVEPIHGAELFCPYRGTKNHTAELNIIPRSHFISTAEPTPQRGEFVYLLLKPKGTQILRAVVLVPR